MRLSNRELFPQEKNKKSRTSEKVYNDILTISDHKLFFSQVMAASFSLALFCVFTTLFGKGESAYLLCLIVFFSLLFLGGCYFFVKTSIELRRLVKRSSILITPSSFNQEKA